MENGEISGSGNGDSNDENEDNRGRNDYDGCHSECKILELLKNVSRVLIPFASSSNFFFLFPFSTS